MIKTQTVAICDVCGRVAQAKASTWRNETNYDIPDGWAYAAGNKGVHLCNVCARKLDMLLKREG